MTLAGAPSLWVGACLIVGACATPDAGASLRDEQRVVDVTGTAIAANPKAWDGKWVRVQGILSANRRALYTPQSAAGEGSPLGWADGSLLLDPANSTDDDDTGLRNTALETPASVTGRVRTVCWEFWKPILAKMDADLKQGVVYTYHPAPPPEFPFCAILSGPYLEHAMIQPTPRNDQ